VVERNALYRIEGSFVYFFFHPLLQPQAANVQTSIIARPGLGAYRAASKRPNASARAARVSGWPHLSRGLCANALVQRMACFFGKRSRRGVPLCLRATWERGIISSVIQKKLF
jgi:hypothetical protein